jgi:hypothetical protein
MAKRLAKFQEWQVKIQRWQAINYYACQENNKMAGHNLLVFQALKHTVIIQLT